MPSSITRNKPLLLTTFVFVILLIASVAIKPVLLGGSVIKVQSGPVLAGQISQSLLSSANASILPINNIDYKLTSTRYFDSDDWVVTTITTLHAKANDSYVVLQKKAGIYQVVLGPGSAFPADYIINLPGDVQQYMQQQGITYESTT